MVAGSRRSAQHDKRLAQSHPLKPVAGLTSLENRAGPGLSKKSVAKRKDFTHGSTGALACASRQTPPGGGGATWFAACLRGRHCRDDSAARLSGLLLLNRSFDFREKLRRQLLHSMRRTCVISALRQY